MPKATAVLHTRVEAHDWLTVGQYDRQLQLCVPLVSLKGDSYRLRNRDLGRVPAPSRAGEQ